ncbi:nucleoside hydrolase [Croceivirga radicis]|uniref:nucleoside hydrolase n=1 Tax=Croceivirga radicis TaxID=1929488 RepID=UPI000255B278|nr:nucleoside hydrolase [Croceivirga radicis]
MKLLQKQTILVLFILPVLLFGQNPIPEVYENVTPRVRVIIDNDFGGDPDGLFQLVHHLLSPSVLIKGIIGSQHYSAGFYDNPGTADFSALLAQQVLDTMDLQDKYTVLAGSNKGLVAMDTPQKTKAAQLIVDEAMRTDTKLPLYIVCGAGLTNLASAYLIEPKIADKIILVWIGGEEYPDLAYPPPNAMKTEYNLGIDKLAAQVVFNQSAIPIWQVPRNAYRLTLISHAELFYRFGNKGIVGEFLVDKMKHLFEKSGKKLGEAYALGDNPLTLLTALQSSWEADPSSSLYKLVQAPTINKNGNYETNKNGRTIRVYTQLDVRLMFNDLEAKLALFGKVAN